MSFLFILVAMSKIYQINNKRWGSDCYILPNTIQVIWKFLRESDKQGKCTIVLWRLNILSQEPKLGEIVAGEKITSERLWMVRFKIYRCHELQILSHFTLYWRVTRKVVSLKNIATEAIFNMQMWQSMNSASYVCLQRSVRFKLVKEKSILWLL